MCFPLAVQEWIYRDYLSSFTLGCSMVDRVHDVWCFMLWIAGKCVLWKQISPNLSGELRTWKDTWKLHSDRRLHACSLSHLAYWAFMFTPEGCSTYYAVYVIRRAFLSSDKEVGLKWHVFGLVGSVSHSGVRFFVWFSSLSHGPSDDYQCHMHVLNGSMFVCMKAWADHGLGCSVAQGCGGWCHGDLSNDFAGNTSKLLYSI